MKWLLALSIAGMAVAPARAQSFASNIGQGNGLLRACEDEGGYAGGLCLGFILGSVQGRAGILSGKTCPSEQVTNGQMIDVVVAYLKAHPKTRDLNSDLLIGAAFIDAWPCPKE